MKKAMLVVLALAFAAIGTGCGGGGSNSPVPELTQVEKANKFVRGMNYYEYTRYEHLQDSFGRYMYDEDGYAIYGTVTYYDYSTQYAVAKGVSQQPGYAVVMDTYSNKYYALSMTDFYNISKPGATYYSNTDAKSYERSMTLNGMAFFNLRFNAGNGTFTQILFDGKEGLTFNARELSTSQVNVAKAKAALYQTKVGRLKNNFVEKFGMSATKALQASSMIVASQTTNGSSDLTLAQANDVMSAVTGLTINDTVQAAQGSYADQLEAMQKAVEAGSIVTPAQGFELVHKVMNELGLVNQ